MYEELSRCTLCPRACGVNRLEGQKGFCGAVGTSVKVARAALHYWEEPCISGSEGSGAVFFSHCTLKCVYCQNRAISRGDAGKEITVERLAEIFLELQGKGAHNINLVTPTHYIPQIVAALDLAKGKGLSLPIVCNTGGYESVEALRLLEGYVDIYLPDFKYASDELARRYSGAGSYFETAMAAVTEMLRQTGDPVFDVHGMMRRGVIVRHLMLPGGYKDSKAVIGALYRTFGDRIYLSIMNQYTPMEGLESFPELNRTITSGEYDRLLDYAVNLGVENGFIQEGGTADESFIPPFDGEGV